MTHQATAGQLQTTRPAVGPLWPLRPHTVLALFENHRAAAAAMATIQATQPHLEPRIIRLAADAPFDAAGRAALEVRVPDDRAMAEALTNAEGVEFVYRAGAWTNESITPRVA